MPTLGQEVSGNVYTYSYSEQYVYTSSVEYFGSISKWLLFSPFIRKKQEIIIFFIIPHENLLGFLEFKFAKVLVFP